MRIFSLALIGSAAASTVAEKFNAQLNCPEGNILVKDGAGDLLIELHDTNGARYGVHGDRRFAITVMSGNDMEKAKKFLDLKAFHESIEGRKEMLSLFGTAKDVVVKDGMTQLCADRLLIVETTQLDNTYQAYRDKMKAGNHPFPHSEEL